MKTRYFVASLFALAASVASAATSVEALPSGVQVEHLVVGQGAQPGASSQVTVHYSGVLASNGKEFDSSYRRGQPATFGLRQVIPCWTQGLQRMAVGGKAILKCPASTAYGARGAGGVIPANAELLFQVELLEVR